ncbi:MATE family efflux transporter [Novosphingobium resinovorum]|uniref:MATE family efflux transporter n=2 Tax=Novosphingobium TaxID=165696 RepID=UPI0025A1CB13|nr:MATE family efflux transporter [Novosphingobium resinovorum]WJM26142.1 MATE family efflux transporter [Novosphingobium resinovorum]
MTVQAALPKAAIPSPVRQMDERTRAMIEGPVVPMILRLALPNVLIMLTQASTGLIETWWVAKLGSDALAGMALVFPALMLMTTFSAGALGGSISSAVARALGGRRQVEADALVLHAVVVNVVLGLTFSALFLVGGERIYRLMGGEGASLHAALVYSDIVFAGNVFLWLMSGLSSVIRGTGNMRFPALVTCIGALFLIPVSPLLIFGFGPVPALGIAGGGAALLVYYAAGTLAMAWHILSGRNPVRFVRAPLRRDLIVGLLRVGGLSALNSVQTNLVIAGTTALVASGAGLAAVAGYGTGVRLEYLLIPLVFGIGAPLIALVATNLGAGQVARARRIALTGAALAFMASETVGLVAAAFPAAWMGLFTHDPQIVRLGSSYLRLVGPFYGFFGVGLALYFASQAAGRLRWPIAGATARLIVAVGGGFLVLRYTGSLTALFVCMSVALAAYGLLVLIPVGLRPWAGEEGTGADGEAVRA